MKLVVYMACFLSIIFIGRKVMKQGRLFQIVYFLLEVGKTTAPELAKKFEVSIRTIYRDLDTISEAGIPVYATQGKCGGISLLPEYVLDKAILSDHEKEKLLASLQSMTATGDVKAEELLSKLSALFKSSSTNWIEVDFSDWIHRNPEQNLFDTLKEAILSRNRIFISYFGSSGQLSERAVEPLKLVFKSKDWYLYAFCLLRNDYRFFKLTRIKELKILSDTFKRDLAEYPKQKAIVNNENLVSVKLKFSPQAAFRVYDEFTDKITEDSDGALYVSIDLPEGEVMFSYLLSFGTNVEILEPDYIRMEMMEKLNVMLNKYKT